MQQSPSTLEHEDTEELFLQHWPANSQIDRVDYQYWGISGARVLMSFYSEST